MAKTNKTPQTNAAAAAPKAKRSYETLKTITIAVLITGILAFAAGAWTMHHFNGEVISAAKAIQPTASAAALPASK